MTSVCWAAHVLHWESTSGNVGLVAGLTLTASLRPDRPLKRGREGGIPSNRESAWRGELVK